ncbi:MAG: choice-of-anchor L domain-containing protein [Chloroflexota bacterium]
MGHLPLWTQTRNIVRILLVLGLIYLIFFTVTVWAFSGFITQDLHTTLTPEDLAHQVVGTGITVSNVTYTGHLSAAGSFWGGLGVIDFDTGIILSSGDIANVVGPNRSGIVRATHGLSGDLDLDALSDYPTMDAAVLEFDFVPEDDMVSFQYVFASDEYNEYVNEAFNDVFAFWINGVNCARVNGKPVSINTINGGNPYGTEPMSNAQFYLNNANGDGAGVTLNTEMDGLTVTLTCVAAVSAKTNNHIKLAIADVNDDWIDSVVFIKADSFVTEPPTAIELVTFIVNKLGDQVILQWETASEIDNEGFHVWRSETRAGSYVRLTDAIIPAHGNNDTGAHYQFVDGTAQPDQIYYYRLEDVDTEGVSTFHSQTVAVQTINEYLLMYLPVIVR